VLRRLSGLCLALLLIAASLPAHRSSPTYAQDASPVAIEPSAISDAGPASAASDAIDEVEPESVSVEPASEPGETLPGSSVGPVFPLPDVYLTFARVLTGGITTAYELDSASVPALPDGYRLDNARIVRIETSATFESNNLVCLIYNVANFADPSTIQLFQLMAGTWISITDPAQSSTASATACGYTSSLGTFAAAGFGTAPTSIPVDTPTPLPTDTSTPTATETLPPTATQTHTPTVAATATRTGTPTPSNTPIPSETSTSTATETSTSSPTRSPSSTATHTSTPEPTETATSSSTAKATATATSSPTETATSTPTHTPANTPSFTATPTSATGQTQYALDNVWVIFSRQPPSGTTHGSVLDGSALPPLPSPYRVANAFFFSIESDVPFTDGKQVCVLFDAARFVNPSSATLLRSTGSGWALLSGQVLSDLDNTQGTTCGYTTVFGAFALAEKLPPTSVPTQTPSRIATATPTPSHTATTRPTWTPTATETPTSSSTPTSTSTSLVTRTPSASATVTSSSTSTLTPIPTRTPSPTQSSTSTPTLAPGSYPTGTTLRATTRVNLRTGPSTASSSLGVVSGGASVQVTGPSTAVGGHNWVPVMVSGLGSGWIAGEYLKSSPSPTPTRTPAAPTATRTPGGSTATRTPTRPPGGFIAGDSVKTTTRLNLRSSPGTGSQVLTVLPTNAYGQVTGSGISSGGVVFYPVLFDGRPSGYVAGSYLRRVAATPTPTRTLVPTATIAGVPTRWTTSSVNMRSGAGTGYRILVTLPKGARLTVTGNPKRSGGYDWYPVDAVGIGPGWVAGKFLTAIPPI
jgi:uncharacterized protein YgiM (DUF1202 family)